jgi:phosphocarrier protein HPr
MSAAPPGQESAAAAGAPVVRVVTIVNKRGLHARAAARFVKLASQFTAQINVTKGDTSVSGSSIMGLMMLAAAPGCQIEIKASGADAVGAVDALAALVDARFHED